MLRASAALNAASACAERCAGVSYYRWLRELEQNFDARADELIETLRALCEKAVCDRADAPFHHRRQTKNAEPVLTGLREALPTGAVPGAPCRRSCCRSVKRAS